MKYPIRLELSLSAVEYLLSVLDEYPQDSIEYDLREEILLQTYE